MLLNKIKEYMAKNVYPMHMPGHKRNIDHSHYILPFDIDITEIHDFDDLHNPQGILLETQQLAAKIYGSNRAYALVNGSTVGILSAIGAHTQRGDKILIANNHHWSVDNAVELFGLKSVEIHSAADDLSGIEGSIDPAVVEQMLDENPDIKLVVITSPSYEGVVSNIASIAAIVHAHNLVLLVDSAHGAHLGFSGVFPKSAIQAGADIVIMSLHKTLPCMTQCSLLHLCTSRAKADETQKMLSMLQTSSPSYVLLASIDTCLHTLNTDHVQLFSEYERNLERFGDEIHSLKKLNVLCHTYNINHLFFDFDPGKIVIVTKNSAISGIELAQTLRTEYSIELEKAVEDYAIAMTSICDSMEGLDRFAKALLEIDRKLSESDVC
jgi:arginine/lysine/ornithine decarboxylase